MRSIVSKWLQKHLKTRILRDESPSSKESPTKCNHGFYIRTYFYPESEGLKAPWGSNPPSFTITLNPAAADCRVISQRPWEYIHRRNSIETGFKMEGEEKPSLFELNLQRQHKPAIKQSLWHPLRTVSLAFPSCTDIQRHQPPESATVNRPSLQPISAPSVPLNPADKFRPQRMAVTNVQNKSTMRGGVQCAFVYVSNVLAWRDGSEVATWSRV